MSIADWELEAEDTGILMALFIVYVYTECLDLFDCVSVWQVE